MTISLTQTLVSRLADALAARGCEVAYGVTGAAIGRFTAAAARSGLRVVHPRHESGAGFMATEHSLASNRLTVRASRVGKGRLRPPLSMLEPRGDLKNDQAIPTGQPEE